MRAFLSLLIAIGLASPVSALALSESSSQDVLVVLGGTLIDGTGSQPRPIAAIEIRSGSFTHIVPLGARYEIPDGALRIDARGRTVVPGIWDAHVHLGADDESSLRGNLGALLASGVTGALSTSDPTDLIVAIREQLRSRELAGPRLFTCGASITPPGGHPGPYVRLITGRKEDPLASRPGPLAGSLEDARQAVRNRVGKKVDAIKIIIEDGPPFSHKEETARMGYEVAAAAVSEARAAGIPVFAHVSSSAEAKDAVRAGVRGLVHSIVEDEMDEELLADLRSRGVGYVTTLSLYEGLMEFTGPDAPWDDPLLSRWVAPRELTESRDPAFLSRLAPLVAWAGAGIPHARSNLRRALDSGLTVALGTDVGNPFVFHGYATHRELAALARAGVDPVQVVRIASLEGARLLGVDDRYGSVEVGKAADLLVLELDPTRELAEAYRRIFTIVQDGKLVDVSSLPLPATAHAGSFHRLGELGPPVQQGALQ